MYKKIETYIKDLVKNSTPDQPAWNIEVQRHGKPNRWNYIDGCFTSSLLSLYEVTKNKTYLDFVENFADYYVFEDGLIRGYDPTHYSTDDVSQSRILFDLFNTTGKEKYLKAIYHSYSQILNHPRTKSGNFWHKQIYHDQVWLDGLYMMQVFYTRFETNFNFKKNYDDIMNQFRTVRKIMFNENDKLYYHCYDESKSLFWANKETGLSSHYWLRAIGWLVAAFADVASYMDDIDNKNELAGLLKECVDGLLEYQDPQSKMFYNIVDRKDHPDNYLETSGSLLISYGILKGVNEGLLDKRYYKIGKEIFDEVIKNRLVTKDGKTVLTGIVLVSGLGPEDNPRRDGTLKYYFSEPVVENDAKGVGPMIMAYTELAKYMNQ